MGAGMRRTEDYHHNAEQVAGYLDAALTLLDERELSEAERCAVLPVLISTLAAKQIFYEQAAPVMLDPRLMGGARR